MARYIDADKVHEEIETIQTSLESNDDKVWRKNKPYYKGLAMARGVINEQPTADVVPKSEVAREIVAKFKTKMHSEIARNELLAEYGDDFYEGRVDAFLTAIERLTEIAMEYSEDKNDT